MKRFIIIAILALLPAMMLRAQEYRVDNGSAQVDSTLVGRSAGYRIRVYYENNQNARNRSEAIARTISGTYPGIGVYRTFESPNFKVCVGDFRTKDEALKLYHALKSSYPTAIILKETINYPR